MAVGGAVGHLDLDQSAPESASWRTQVARADPRQIDT